MTTMSQFSQLSFRGAPKARTRNPDAKSLLVLDSGSHAAHAPRNDNLSGALLFALDCQPPDIAAAEAVRPVDLGDGGIGLGLRLGHALADGADVQHASAIGENARAIALGAGMEDFHPVDSRRVVEPLDERT